MDCGHSDTLPGEGQQEGAWESISGFSWETQKETDRLQIGISEQHVVVPATLTRICSTNPNLNKFVVPTIYS